MYRITKEFHFAASHIIEGLVEGHKCGRLHGHNYIVEVELRSESLDATGFVVDYGDLLPIKDWIDKTLDHRHLNDVIVGFATSAEVLAWFIFREFRDRFPALYEVRVSETPKTWAAYRRDE